jgi:predicted transcriptional regulator
MIITNFNKSLYIPHNIFQFAIRELQIESFGMKNHNGMCPQDVVILLKLSTINSESLCFADIASSLKISASEVSKRLERSLMARLVTGDKRELHYDSFLGFLFYGMKYVFPVSPGSVVRGLATAHSAPP